MYQVFFYLGDTSANEQFSKVLEVLISIRFNLLQFCPSVASVVSVMLF